jgi:stage IV sporulation protein FB
MLGMPATTDFDLNFRLLRIPVRIHPFFWVLSAALGWEGRDGAQVLVWIACVFVSILVHEFGHGLTARALSGQRPTVVLYAMGGLCFTDGEDRSAGRRIAMILMGPGAGFLLAGVVAALEAALLGSINFGAFNWYFHDAPRWTSGLMYVAFGDLLWINLFWGLVNLFPIYPLDGGQIAQTLLKMHNRREGARRGFILSLVTAGLLAIYLYQDGQTYNALFIGYLGLINFQFLQAAQEQGRYGVEPEDDDTWWR